MGLSPHQVLSKLAEKKREDAQVSLAEFERQRGLIEQKCTELKSYRAQLTQERDALLHGSTKVSMLMMLGEAMQEQHLRLQQLEQGLQTLHEQEQSIRAEWMLANQEQEVHQKMQKKLDDAAQRKQDLRRQQQMDDVFAARVARGVEK